MTHAATFLTLTGTVAIVVGVGLLILACGGGKKDEPSSEGDGDGDVSGDGDVPGDGDGDGVATGGGDGDGDTGGDAGDGDSAETGGSSGTGGGASSYVFQYPAEIIGGECDPAAEAASEPCPWGPEQSYCSKSDPTQIIMATCSSAGRDQCEVMDTCSPGWHACTATDYIARGGADIMPDFSSATDTAWLAACVSDAQGTILRNVPCSNCGADPGREPSIEWWCDGEVVYEGGMAGDALGVIAAPQCMRVGENVAPYGAYWGMAFSGGSPSFVMCCLDL